MPKTFPFANPEAQTLDSTGGVTQCGTERRRQQNEGMEETDLLAVIARWRGPEKGLGAASCSRAYLRW